MYYRVLNLVSQRGAISASLLMILKLILAELPGCYCDSSNVSSDKVINHNDNSHKDVIHTQGYS